MILEYFDVHGRGLAIRLIKEYTGAQFEDKKVDFADFGARKAQGAYKYGQVPVMYLEDGTQIAQT